jgi:hypothetical protein
MPEVPGVRQPTERPHRRQRQASPDSPAGCGTAGADRQRRAQHGQQRGGTGVWRRPAQTGAGHDDQGQPDRAHDGGRRHRQPGPPVSRERHQAPGGQLPGPRGQGEERPGRQRVGPGQGYRERRCPARRTGSCRRRARRRSRRRGRRGPAAGVAASPRRSRWRPPRCRRPAAAGGPAPRRNRASRTVPVVSTSRESSPVMRKPEMTKKTSTPTNPPATPGTPAWNRTTASTATARRPSMSGRKPHLAAVLCITSRVGIAPSPGRSPAVPARVSGDGWHLTGPGS